MPDITAIPVDFDYMLEVVRRIAKKIKREYMSRAELDELIGDGNLGLVEACQGYKPPSKNHPCPDRAFLAYAILKIRGRILSGARSRRKHVRRDGTQQFRIVSLDAIPWEELPEVESFEPELMRIAEAENIEAHLRGLWPSWRELLKKRYVEDKTLTQIAEEMHRSRAWVWKAHSQSLKVLQYQLRGMRSAML